MPEFDVDEVRDILDELYQGPDWETRPKSALVDRFEASKLPQSARDAIRNLPEGEWTRADLMRYVNADLGGLLQPLTTGAESGRK